VYLVSLVNWLSQIFGLFKSFQCWIVIAPWEAALRVRFGKHATVLGPGPHLRIPFVDRIFVQSVRLRTISDSGQTMSTRDGKQLTLAVAVSYAIGDIRQLYMTVSNPESTLLNQIQGVIAEVIANEDSERLTPRLIEERATAKMPSSDWGLVQVRVMVTTFAYVKTYRLMNYECRVLSNVNDLEQTTTNR
jgi:regulator of protease activity HflC (stomatin/prohibitin superfamily)